MRFAIVGAGAIGAFAGAMLARSGEMRMRVWFEMAGGQPRVSVSPPTDPQAPAPNAFGEVTRKAGKAPYYPKAAQQKGDRHALSELEGALAGLPT